MLNRERMWSIYRHQRNQWEAQKQYEAKVSLMQALAGLAMLPVYLGSLAALGYLVYQVALMAGIVPIIERVLSSGIVSLLR